MRIIAGSRRGAKLTKLDAANTRPTADRVRESLFNILDGGRFGRALTGAVVIDAFAGTGALGLEALSRGAVSACFIEQTAEALAVLRAGAPAPQGPQGRRLLPRAYARGGHHDARCGRDQILPAAAAQLVPSTDQVPRRDPAALRADARARVRHEGRLLL